MSETKASIGTAVTTILRLTCVCVCLPLPAANVLDVKTQGCVRTEECGAATTLELYPNATVYTVTRHCCHTAFCNAAHRTLPAGACSYLTATTLALWYLTGAAGKLLQ